MAGLRKESGCVFYVNARHFESCTARNLKITQHSQRKEREKGKMLKKLMKKEEGFTLAELLIVVAIIAVLVAISIPIFTTQLEKSREATDISNVRSSYAVVVSEALTQQSPEQITATVTLKQQQNGWQGADPTSTLAQLGATFNGVSSEPIAVSVSGSPTQNGTGTITYTPPQGATAGSVTIAFA